MGNTFRCLFPSWKKGTSSSIWQIGTESDDNGVPVANTKENDDCVWKIEDLETNFYAAPNSNQARTYDDPIRSPESDTEKATDASVSTKEFHHSSIVSGFADVSSSGQRLVKNGQDLVKNVDWQLHYPQKGNYRDYRRVKDLDCIPVTLRQANEDYSKRMNKQRQMTRALLKPQRSPSPDKASHIATKPNTDDTANSKGDVLEKTEEGHIYSETDGVRDESLVQLKDAFFTEFSVDKYDKDVIIVSSFANIKKVEEISEFHTDYDKTDDNPRSLNSDLYDKSYVEENDDCIASDCNAGNTVLFSQMGEKEFSDCLAMFKRGASINPDNESIELSNDTYAHSDIEDSENTKEASGDIDKDDATHDLVDEIIDYRKPSKRKRKQLIREHKMHELITIVEDNEEEVEAEMSILDMANLLLLSGDCYSELVANKLLNVLPAMGLHCLQTV